MKVRYCTLSINFSQKLKKTLFWALLIQTWKCDFTQKWFISVAGLVLNLFFSSHGMAEFDKIMTAYISFDRFAGFWSAKFKQRFELFDKASGIKIEKFYLTS